VRLFELVDDAFIKSNKLTLPDIIRKIDGRINGWFGGYNYVDNLNLFEQKLLRIPVKTTTCSRPKTATHSGRKAATTR